MKNNIQLLKELKTMYNINNIGEYIDTNDDVQNSLIEAFNIDDNGIVEYKNGAWEEKEEE